jgi:hypothetical protein
MQLKTVNAFLSMPYGKNPEEQAYWRLVSKSIIEIAREVKLVKLEIHLGKDEVHSLSLKENVKTAINAAHFTIAIVTKSNPNVFWEIGYTESQGKPVVYLMDEDVKELADSPVLIVEALKCVYQSSDLGNNDLPLEFKLRVKGFLDIAVKAVLGKPRSPQVQVIANRLSTHLPNKIMGAENRVHIITTNLSYFAADKSMFLHSENEDIFVFDPPINKKVEVKILTLDPESPIVKYRAHQLGFEYKIAEYREELREGIRSFYQRYKGQHNVQIRLYDDLPLQITCMIDDEVITSIMSRGHRGRQNLHLTLDMNTPGARDSFEVHFNEVAAAPSSHISTFAWATAT